MLATRRTFATLFVGMLVVFLSACSGTRVGTKAAEQYNSQPLRVAIPSGVDTAQALEAAENALIARGWAVVDKSYDSVTGKLVHRKFDATANIKIEGENLVLYSDSTYKKTETSDPEPAVPYGWLENLQKDIQKFLAYEGSS
ncbi:MAG: hypothetical protein PVH25_11265 [Burkholderiales bacterium]|jgi:hypothetical protein